MRTLQSELADKGIWKSEEGKQNDRSDKSLKKVDERLTEKDLRDLMGLDRDTYKRVGGAIRRR